MVIGDLKHIEHLLTLHTLTEFLLNTASSLIQSESFSPTLSNTMTTKKLSIPSTSINLLSQSELLHTPHIMHQGKLP